MMTEFLPSVFSGDRRLVELPRRERIAEVGMPAIRAWLEPLLADGPLEVTVVGDVDVDQVIEASAHTIGALPDRRDRRPYADRLDAGPVATGVELRRTVETEIEKALVMLCFPCGDGLETARRRELQFLGRVIADRLRVKVREELGASYSPAAQASPDRVFPSIGLISIVASTDPAEVGVLVDACYEVALDLADNGVTEEEVARLKEPLLAQVRDALRTNAFWLGSLADVQQRPQTLDDIRSYSDFYRTISTEALSRHAAVSLGRQQASLLVVNPAE
jgi:zinc protease